MATKKKQPIGMEWQDKHGLGTINKPKSKYTRRRAIDCKLIERSSTHKDYCEYMITIAELDGTIHKQPAYGKDMQSALARLMNQERTKWFERKLMSGWIFALWLIAMGWPIITINPATSPMYLLYAFGSIMIILGLTAWWNHYINKGE